MKNNYDFAKFVGIFLSEFLPNQRNLSHNTISSYCDTFKLLILYCKNNLGLKIDKVSVQAITRDVIVGFLEWLAKSRSASISTQNQRLGCIHSFMKYVQGEKPEYLFESQRILNIQYKKKQGRNIGYLNFEDVKLLLAQVDTSTQNGRRDLTLLSLLYDTAARVQEISDLTVQSIRLEPPAQITIIGKGNKARCVPILKNTVDLLSNYLIEQNLIGISKNNNSLFTNSQNSKLGRAGICYILKKYFKLAKKIEKSLPLSISPHILRHSKAMHLLEAGVNVIYIRDILGHVDVSTTEIYAKANLKMKRDALQKIETTDYCNKPFWLEDNDLMSWLSTFGKSL